MKTKEEKETEKVEEICFWIGLPIILITSLLAMKGFLWIFYIGGGIVFLLMLWIINTAFKEVKPTQ